MEKYLLANQRSVLNRETWKFEPIRGIITHPVLEIPFYLWTYGKESDEKVSEYPVKGRLGLKKVNRLTSRKVYSLELNDLVITWPHKKWRDTRIEFRDPVKGSIVELVLSMQPVTTGLRNVGGRLSQLLVGAYYNLSIMGDIKVYQSNFNDDSFGVMPGMGWREIDNLGLKGLACGIKETQYDIEYNGDYLGQSYAFTCGTWCILLGDDMKFDTLAYLEGCERGTLKVDRFVYTTNTFVLKKMILGR